MLLIRLLSEDIAVVDVFQSFSNHMVERRRYPFWKEVPHQTWFISVGLFEWSQSRVANHVV